MPLAPEEHIYVYYVNHGLAFKGTIGQRPILLVVAKAYMAIVLLGSAQSH